MNHEKALLHLSFMSVATLLVFWTARATIPLWVVLPALAVLAAGPWLQRHKLAWEAIIGVALIGILATNGQRLAMDYAARYREFFFLLVPMLFYAGIVRTRLKVPGEPVYLGNIVWLALLITLDVEGAAISIAVLSFLVLLALLLAGTEDDRPRFLQRLVPVAIILVVVTVLATSLPVETGPFSASTAQGLQDFLFGHSTAVDFVPVRHTTNWWKPWPTTGTSLLGSWLMRVAFAEESHVLSRSLLLAPLAILIAWIFLGRVLQQGPGKSLKRLLPALVVFLCMGGVFVALISIHSKALDTLMFGPLSPWIIDGKLLVPRTWQMFLALRLKVSLFPTSAVILLRLILRNLSILVVLYCGATCIRQAFATRWDRLEGIGRRRDRIIIERTIKRIRSLDDDQLLRDPRGTVIAIFYMAANALYPLDLAMVRGETPTELTTRVARWYPDLAEEVDVLGRLFYVARYSKVEVTPDQVKLAKTTYQTLLEMLKVEARHPRIKTEGALPISQ
ncbi:MAG TPA: DUF4129 domain-containing protein [Clostridia bacterium]|nr:DUF4129 domain-containing protein [Clostridia bacterium]